MSMKLVQTAFDAAANQHRVADSVATPVSGLDGYSSPQRVDADRPREPAQRRFLLQAMERLGIDDAELARRLCVGQAVVDGWLQESVGAESFRELEPSTWQLVREMLRVGQGGGGLPSGLAGPSATLAGKGAVVKERKPASRS